MCIAWPDEMQPTWSAGYGFNGPPTDWAIDAYAVSIEMAQPDDSTSFTEACLERTARAVARLCQAYSIPAVWLDAVDQTGEVPTGVTGHDRTDNGRRLGKTDPGAMFPVAWFMEMVRQIMGEPTDDIAALEARAAHLEAIVAASGAQQAAEGEGGPYDLLASIRELQTRETRLRQWLQTAGYHLDLAAQALKNV